MSDETKYLCEVCGLYEAKYKDYVDNNGVVGSVLTCEWCYMVAREWQLKIKEHRGTEEARNVLKIIHPEDDFDAV